MNFSVATEIDASTDIVWHVISEIERWAATNDPVDRYIDVLRRDGVDAAELAAIDARVQREIDDATDLAEASPMPEATDALHGVYADPPSVEPLWYRRGVASAVDAHEPLR